MTLIVCIWAFVDHTLCVVHVAVLTETAGELRNVWISDIDNVESACTSTTTHRVKKACFLVQDDVVGATKLVVVSRLLQDVDSRLASLEVTQLGQVVDLQSMIRCLAADKSMVVVHLKLLKVKLKHLTEDTCKSCTVGT